MFDLIDPSHSGDPSRSRPYVASSACASIGSPSVVPVPCASTASTSSGRSPADSNAAWITRSCDGPFGAVSPLDAPSWFTAEPRTTPSTRWPLRTASDSRSSTTIPTPSDQPVPSADAANGRPRPSGDKPRWRENSTNTNGVGITETPPARATEHSPARNAEHAQCIATSDEEQAVSTVTAGPSRPSVYATRPDATLTAVPVSRYPSSPG